MGNHTRNLFVADPVGFLRDHVVSVRGAQLHQTKSGVSTVQAAAGNPAFAMGANQTGVRLDAPLVEAYFEKQSPAVMAATLPFSRPKIRIELDAPGTNPKSLQNVYLIPYAGEHGHGVKLPSQATDGHPIAYAVTSAQNGCTVVVSGNSVSPYVSHTNVADAAAPARQAAITQRLNSLQADFHAAELAAGIAPGGAAADRTRFGHFQPAGPGPGLAPIEHNYSNESFNTLHTQLMQAGNPRTTKVARRDNLGRAGHSNYRYRVDPNCTALAPGAASQAQVVARRQGGSWTFYFQIWNPVAFQITKKDKMGKITYRQTQNNILANVVLSWGQLWPLNTANFVVF